MLLLFTFSFSLSFSVLPEDLEALRVLTWAVVLLTLAALLLLLLRLLLAMLLLLLLALLLDDIELVLERLLSSLLLGQSFFKVITAGVAVKPDVEASTSLVHFVVGKGTAALAGQVGIVVATGTCVFDTGTAILAAMAVFVYGGGTGNGAATLRLRTLATRLMVCAEVV